jgi:hypothetical protein
VGDAALNVAHQTSSRQLDGMTAMHSISMSAPGSTSAFTTTVLRVGGELGQNFA